MTDIASIAGIRDLWAKTTGDPRIVVAVLDGPVDRSHPCFEGARLQEHMGYMQGNDQTRPPGPMSAHGTHVASVIFGQHGSPISGVAPGCTGLLFPVFSDRRRRLSQLDLSRAVEAAVEAGAHVINISGGQLTNVGEADGWLSRAIEFCAENNVLVVAAAGNDGCQCLHVPAALPTVIAVGAMDDDGNPLDFSNWGKTYETQGILAPGKDILGAALGGGTKRNSGTSMANPVVSGVAALLLSMQLDRGKEADPHVVRAAMLHGADPCNPKEIGDCSRFLVGTLNVTQADNALTAIERKELPMFEHSEASSETTSLNAGEPPRSTEAVSASCSCDRNDSADDEQPTQSNSPSQANAATASGDSSARASAATSAPAPPLPVAPTSASAATVGVAETVQPSQTSSELTYAFQPGGGLIFALGTLGYDFGTEARRDSFKQLMGSVFPNDYRTPFGPNPYDARDLVMYLKYLRNDGVLADEGVYDFLDEAKSLIWTLNLELTPIYGLEPLGPFSREVYKTLVDVLDNQIKQAKDPDYVERVSIPGLLGGRTVRLYSGQMLPIVELENTRGLYGWKINDLVQAALEKIKELKPELEESNVREQLTNFLNRLYYDFRNLGTTSPDRALNYSVTNMVQHALGFADALRDGKELDTIEVLKSPTCRLDSDCWDVKLKFFDPLHLTKAVKVLRFTIDVSDKMPVTLGTIRTWAQRY